MNRDYQTGKTDSAIFFVGKEVEHTPAFGLNTLFVVGVQPTEEIAKRMENCQHIFFGANHSFDPSDFNEWESWKTMIKFFLDKEYLCSLDIPVHCVESFNESGLNEYNNFIPQIRVPIPYIRLWNYNTMIKIDDRDFNSTNPGIWTHSLHTLMNRNKFTDWNQYHNDQIVK